jgi:hypothetical protein
LLRFFRLIRKKLIEEDRIRTYFYYAIGEIFLVVIGILIALQINNWNEGRKKLEQEKEIIRNLSIEFQQNLEELNKDIWRGEATLNALRVLMNVMTDPKKIESEGQIDTLIANTLFTPTWNPSFYVIEDLKSAGGLSRLSNDSLKEALFEWERFYSNLMELQDVYRRSSDYYVLHLRNEGGLRNIDSANPAFDIERSVLPVNNIKLLKDYRFENNLDDYYVTATGLFDAYKETAKKVEYILTLTSVD